MSYNKALQMDPHASRLVSPVTAVSAVSHNAMHSTEFCSVKNETEHKSATIFNIFIYLFIYLNLFGLYGK